MNAGSQESHEVPQDDHDVGRQLLPTHQVARLHRTLSVPEDFESLVSSGGRRKAGRDSSFLSQLKKYRQATKQQRRAEYTRAGPDAITQSDSIGEVCEGSREDRNNDGADVFWSSRSLQSFHRSFSDEAWPTAHRSSSSVSTLSAPALNRSLSSTSFTSTGTASSCAELVDEDLEGRLQRLTELAQVVEEKVLKQHLREVVSRQRDLLSSQDSTVTGKGALSGRREKKISKPDNKRKLETSRGTIRTLFSRAMAAFG